MSEVGSHDQDRVRGRAARILLVDDEQPVQKLLSFPLEKEGYEVVPALDGQEALRRFENERFDLVVLDIMLPKMDGLEVCRRLRAKSAVPIIMLTAKAEEIDKVLGLEIGADDYITKPFSPLELRSRIRALLRRTGGGSQRVIDAGALRIDSAKRTVTRNGEPIRLTKVEFEILFCLAESPGQVFRREELLEHLWDSSAYRDLRTIDVHIRHLREKIETDPREPEYLLTDRGVGYHFREE
jgi:DNA-binding response OmpR family regulator